MTERSGHIREVEIPMSASAKKKYTAEEYAALELVAGYKSEFYRGEIFPMHGHGGPIPMAGAKFGHNRIKDNLVVEISNRLKGSSCQTLSSDMRIRVEPTGLQTYPDVLILCGSPVFADDTEMCLLNPSVVIEVLSPSTESYDRGTKFRHYGLIPSLNEIVFVEPDEPVCERYVRAADGVTWNRATIEGLDASLAFATENATIPLRDICAGVEFPEPPLR
jgi:Uma2 family endonuclease